MHAPLIAEGSRHHMTYAVRVLRVRLARTCQVRELTALFTLPTPFAILGPSQCLVHDRARSRRNETARTLLLMYAHRKA